MTPVKIRWQVYHSSPRPAVRKQQLTMISSSTNEDKTKPHDTRAEQWEAQQVYETPHVHCWKQTRWDYVRSLPWYPKVRDNQKKWRHRNSEFASSKLETCIWTFLLRKCVCVFPSIRSAGRMLRDSQRAELVTGRSRGGGGFKILRPAGKIQLAEVDEKHWHYSFKSSNVPWPLMREQQTKKQH